MLGPVRKRRPGPDDDVQPTAEGVERDVDVKRNAEANVPRLGDPREMAPMFRRHGHDRSDIVLIGSVDHGLRQKPAEAERDDHGRPPVGQKGLALGDHLLHHAGIFRPVVVEAIDHGDFRLGKAFAEVCDPVGPVRSGVTTKRAGKTKNAPAASPFTYHRCPDASGPRLRKAPSDQGLEQVMIDELKNVQA